VIQYVAAVLHQAVWLMILEKEKRGRRGSIYAEQSTDWSNTW